MRILISGAAGFLGSWLADAFLEKDWEVVGVDNLHGGYRSNVPSGVEFKVGDCCDLPLMNELAEGADVVYHCAASAYEGFSAFAPAVVAKNVYLSSVSLLSAACNRHVKRFVLCSSMARYGSNRVPFTESMRAKPVDPYGVAKVASEDVLRIMASVHGVEFNIAIPHNIYGPRQKYDDPYRNVVSIFINQMLQGEQPYIYGDGTQKRCFSYVKDVVPPLVQLATREDVKGQAFNIGPDEEFVTINHLAELIADLLGFDLHANYVRDRPLEVKLANCSASKARRLLDYKTRWSLRDGVAETIKWIRQAGPKPFDYSFLKAEIDEGLPQTWKNELFNRASPKLARASRKRTRS